MPGRAGRAEPAAGRHRRSRPTWWSSALAPALDEGLLVVEPGAHQAVRFRHDRIREAILRRAGPAAAARPAAGAWRGGWPRVPELFAVAAEQYLPVVDAVDDAAERRQVVGLLRRAADQARVDRRLRAGERAAGRRAAADRPGRDRHAGRGAHRPPRRAVQPGAPGGGGRGVPHDRAAVRRPRWSARTRRRCRCAA